MKSPLAALIWPRLFRRALSVLTLTGLLLAVPADVTALKDVVRKNNNARQQQQKPGESVSPQGAVYMLDADRFDGAILTLNAGQLSIDSDPPRTVPLDEVDRIDLGTGASVLMVWVGQDNHDGAQAGSGQGTNGIQDIHLECRGIAIGRQLTQVVISGVFGGVAQVWMLNPGNTPFWKLENSRPNNSTTTNFYLEPPPGDCFDQSLDVMLSFNDNTTFKTKLKATTHTDSALKFEKQPDATNTPGEVGPLVFLSGDETVRARSIEIGNEMLMVQAVTGGELQIPMAEVRGIWLGGNNSPQQRKRFDDKLKEPGQSDWVLIRARDKEEGKEAEGKPADGKEGEAKATEAKAEGDAENAAASDDGNPQANKPNKKNKKPVKPDKNDNDKTVTAVDGSVQSLSLGKLSLTVDEDVRKVALARVVALVMAAHPASARPESLYQIFELASGEKMAGQLTAIKPDVLDIHTRYGGDMQLPRGEVRSVTCRNGRATYLSDLEPASVDETSYFDRPLSYHRDQGLSGGPLAVRGTTYRKGLAVHSRCVLTYTLNGQYELFRTRLGFEDGAPLSGSIACRVLADDRELYANPTFRSDTEPLSLKLDLTGAKQLVLEVDFGETQNIGDRIVWGAARLVRPADAAAQPAVTPPVATAAATTESVAAAASAVDTAAPEATPASVEDEADAEETDDDDSTPAVLGLIR